MTFLAHFWQHCRGTFEFWAVITKMSRRERPAAPTPGRTGDLQAWLEIGCLPQVLHLLFLLPIFFAQRLDQLVLLAPSAGFFFWHEYLGACRRVVAAVGRGP